MIVNATPAECKLNFTKTNAHMLSPLVHLPNAYTNCIETAYSMNFTLKIPLLKIFVKSGSLFKKVDCLNLKVYNMSELNKNDE